MRSVLSLLQVNFGRSNASKQVKRNGGSTPNISKKVSSSFPFMYMKKGF
jgi:hypothetical protein